MPEMGYGVGAHPSFIDAGMGYRGGDGFGGGMGFLLALLLARGGFTDQHGCHHKCNDLNGAQAILDRMSVSERQTLAHDVRDSLGERIKDGNDRVSERIKDTRDDIADALKCLGDRFKDNLDCVKESVGEVRANVREIGKELCDIKADTRAGFAEVRGLIKETALVSELRDTKDRLDDSRRMSDRDYLDKKLCEEERACGRGRRDHGHDRDGLSVRDLAALGFRLVGPACEPASNGGGHGH